MNDAKTPPARVSAATALTAAIGGIGGSDTTVAGRANHTHLDLSVVTTKQLDALVAALRRRPCGLTVQIWPNDTFAHN